MRLIFVLFLGIAEVSVQTQRAKCVREAARRSHPHVVTAPDRSSIRASPAWEKAEVSHSQNSSRTWLCPLSQHRQEGGTWREQGPGSTGPSALNSGIFQSLHLPMSSVATSDTISAAPTQTHGIPRKGFLSSHLPFPVFPSLVISACPPD